MTDDDLLCSEADLAHLALRAQVIDLQDQIARGREEQLKLADRMFGRRFPEPATDPYEIEKD